MVPGALALKKINVRYMCSKKGYTELPYDQAFPLLGVYLREMKIYVHTKTVHEYS